MVSNPEIRKAFVCGWPIAHSRSPLIHGHWLQKHGLAGSYEKIAVHPDELVNFVRTMKKSGFAGGNFTIPHKEAVLRLVDRLDPAAEKIGAVNTLWFEGETLVGGNTDWIGFAANLDQAAPAWDEREDRKKPVMVLGAGGAARAIVYALLQRGFENILLINRTLENAVGMAKDFGNRITAASFDGVAEMPTEIALLVNTTSLGMSGQQSLPQEIVSYLHRMDRNAIVHDIVYIPLETQLLGLARKLGFETVDGLGMLLHQAVPGFERWFGLRPEVTKELRGLILRDIGESK